MPDFRPAALKKRPALEAIAFWAALGLGIAVVDCSAFLLATAPTPTLDANGNPLIARDYGSFAPARP